MNKRIIGICFLAAFASAVCAQSGTNSPYSQFGLGLLSDQSGGFNRGMNGLGIAWRDHQQVNHLNPASYSSIDSLTFIFDAGISGQITNFNENGVKKNANNANFEYAVAAFRAFRHVGVSFGLLPFTDVGYNYQTTYFVDDSKSTTYTNTYSGEGGLHEVYLGVGWEPFRGFSLGANIAYLWGQYTKNVVNAYSDNSINTLSKAYAASVRNYKLDVGLQYAVKMGKNDVLTLGATYGLGHKLNADPTCSITTTNTQSSVSNNTLHTVKDGLELPNTFGGGFTWKHNNQLTIGADYQLQQWGKVAFPDYTGTTGDDVYVLNANYFKDRHKLTVGGEYCNNVEGSRFLSRLRLRAGASYATPHLQINGQDGPRELSVSAGFGIPIVNRNTDRSRGFHPSLVNISGQWLQRSANTLIKENTFLINIGITFNERWFDKWKFN